MRPPEVPAYFNAGHHLPLFAAGAYLRLQPEVASLDVLDAEALNLTWEELGDRLYSGGYDIVAIMNDLCEVQGLARLVDYARQLSPTSRLVTFGRFSSKVPELFQRYDLDGVVCAGDYETGLVSFLRWARDPEAPRPGLAVRSSQGWLPPNAPPALLPVEEWALPDVREIPYEHYDRLYAREENRFCGLPGRRELVVPVARGCPIGCEFCEVWSREGLRERRLPVRRVVEYIERSFDAAPFDYAAMYAPTFTLRRRWTLDFCDSLRAAGSYPWKCTTTLAHLDFELLASMKTSGCLRVSVGLETLDPGAQADLPSAKHCGPERLDEVAGWCLQLGIELNCFIIIGLPGSSVEATLETARRVQASGARLRPSIYTPYDRLSADIDDRTIERFNRQLFTEDVTAQDAARLYGLIFARDRARAGI